VAALPSSSFGRRAGSPASFVALAGPGNLTAIERFSLLNGRRLGVVARVPPIKETSEGYFVSNPELMPDGSYLLAVSHDVDCKQVPSSECIPLPDTCATRVEALAADGKRARLLFTEPHDRYAYDALPSPDGTRVALFEHGCLALGDRIAIRDVRTGRERVVVRNTGLCASELSWSPDGSQIVFTHAAHFSGTTAAGGCSLAVASSRHYSSASSWRVVVPDKACGFSSVAFDPAGLAALEQCGPVGTTPTTGLLQFDRHLHLVRRLSLPQGTPGMGNEETELANDPDAHLVLVSQSEQGANVVSAFNGRRLRVIGRYKNRVLAEP
jgi:dipeptidyl aminopeptidase/acylaminoacyl peptidase